MFQGFIANNNSSTNWEWAILMKKNKQPAYFKVQIIDDKDDNYMQLIQGLQIQSEVIALKTTYWGLRYAIQDIIMYRNNTWEILKEQEYTNKINPNSMGISPIQFNKYIYMIITKTIKTINIPNVSI